MPCARRQDVSGCQVVLEPELYPGHPGRAAWGGFAQSHTPGNKGAEQGEGLGGGGGGD